VPLFIHAALLWPTIHVIGVDAVLCRFALPMISLTSGCSTMHRLILRLLALTVLVAPGVAAQATPADAAAVQGNLRPGDLIRLKIWREPDLSGDFPVSQTGDAVLPKIGTVNVTPLSVDSLTRFLRATYETYLRNPTIEVTLLRRITVSGAVRNPGLYPVDPTMTVADAVALAGGATGDGRLDRVYLSRGGKRMTIALNANSRLSDTPLTSGDQLSVPLRSWFSRNASWLVSGTLAMAGLVVAVATR
jgi:polysaccharide export outer membrane protein